MIFFWLIAVLLIVAALLFVLPTFLQRNIENDDGIARNELNVVVYKDQLEELESDLANGLIEQAQYELAKSDLERSLLEGAGSLEETEHSEDKSGKLSGILAAIGVPLLAVALYAQLGGGEHAFSPESAPMEVSNDQHETSIEEMVATLEARLEADPRDGEGWAMLGRSYYFMKRFGEAVAAYEKAMSVGAGSDPAVLADFADAQAMANGRNMAGKPYELIKKALQINPGHEKSLWLAGTAAYQERDYRSSMNYWQTLHGLFAPDSENAIQIQKNIDEVKVLLGEKVEAPPSVAKSATNSTAAIIHGYVQLDAKLKSRTSPNDTVFVFARATNGPRMPLAIVRKQVKDLPFEFTLDDSMAMNPSFKLSSFPSVVVGARISKSGQAMPQSGDLEGHVPGKQVDENGKVNVLISNVMP